MNSLSSDRSAAQLRAIIPTQTEITTSDLRPADDLSDSQLPASKDRLYGRSDSWGQST